MPLLHLKCSKEIPSDLIPALSSLIAEGIGKPEQYVMVVVDAATIMMSGSEGNAAHATIKSLGGLSAEVNRSLSASLCSLLNDKLGIPPERVYINFESCERDQWGWNGSTFG